MNLDILDKKIHKLIVFCFFFMFLTTPFIWVEANSELFELPKMTFVYTMTVVITSLWLSRMVVAKRILVRRSWFDYPLMFFFTSQMLSTLFSMHFNTSLFGYYTRLHGGFLSTLSYILLYYAFVSNLTRKQTRKSIGILVASGILSALLAFPEHFGYALSCLIITGHPAATCWQQDIVTRVFGTFGQPNWLAAYLITLIPLYWIELYPGYKKTIQLKYVVLLLGTVISIATLFFTKSRSGMAALGLGTQVFFLANFIVLTKKKKLSLVLGVSTMLSAIIITIYLINPVAITNQFKGLPFVASYAVAPDPVIDSLSQEGTDSFAIRQIVWKGALEVFKHNFLLGSGVETFAYSYYNFRPVEHNLLSEWDFLYNKAHNELLNFAATTGIVGLSSYLSIVIGFVVMVLLHDKKLLTKKSTKKDKQTGLILHALLAGFLALFVSNVSGFSTVSVGVLFFILPAIAVVLLFPEPKSDQNQKSSGINSSQYFGLFLIGVLMASSIYLIGNYYYSDIVFARAEKAESANDLNQAIRDYQTAIKLAPSQARFYNSYANSLSKAAYAFASDGNLEATERFAEQAFLASAKTLELNPVHINFYKSQAGVFIRLSPINMELLDFAEQILENGLLMAPTDAKMVYNIGLIELDKQATPAAQKRFEQAIDLKPNYETARMELAQIYEDQGELQNALIQYQYIVNYIAPHNSTARKGIERLSHETP